MNYDVFISYSRKDSAIVDEFVRLMEAEEFRVWIDRDGIESGDVFKRVIVRAIKESALVVFFSSESSNASSWTAKEISIAVHHSKLIIPIKIDKTIYNDEVEFDLVGLDYIDYTDVATHEAMKAKLLRTLRSKLPERWEEICQAKAEKERSDNAATESEPKGEKPSTGVNEQKSGEDSSVAKNQVVDKQKEETTRERLGGKTEANGPVSQSSSGSKQVVQQSSGPVEAVPVKRRKKKKWIVWVVLGGVLVYFLLIGLVMAISGAFTDSYHGEIGGLTIATTEVKDFNSLKMFYHEYEVAIENSNSCDELHVIYSEIWYCNNFYVGGERAFFNDVYRKMTESEKSEIDKIVKGLFYKTEVKRASLGCGEEIYDIDMFQ